MNQIEEMSQNMNEVFNTYNLNILFTVAALPSRVSLGLSQIQSFGGMGAAPVPTMMSQPPGGALQPKGY